MPTFLSPMGWLALAALAIPLLVHLARRQTLVPTPFAALRWLRPRARPRRQVRWDEWLLLLLRLLLLALFAAWLAQPALQRGAPPERWVMLAPGIDPLALPAPGDGETRRWLAPGWPVVDASAGPSAGAAVPPGTAGAEAGVGTLLRQLDMTLPAGASLVVHVPDPLVGADAQRPQLSREVEWRVMHRVIGSGDDGGRSSLDDDAAVDAVAAGDPGIGIGERDAAPTRPPPRLAIRHDAAHAGAVRYLRAAAEVWQAEIAATMSTGADMAAATGRRGTPARDTATPMASASDAATANESADGERAGSQLSEGERSDGAAVEMDIVQIADTGVDVAGGADAVRDAIAPALPATTTLLAWLVAGPVPDAVRDFVADGGTALLAADADWPGLVDAPPVRDPVGTLQATALRHGRGRVVGLGNAFDPALWPGLVEADFPDVLRRAVDPPPAPTRAPASDYAPVAGAPAWPIGWRDLRPPLLWLILGLLLAERWLATSRRRSASP